MCNVKCVLILTLEEALEPLRRQLGVARGVLDVLVPEPFLQGAGVLAVVGELEAAGVPRHVRVSRRRAGGGGSTSYGPQESGEAHDGGTRRRRRARTGDAEAAGARAPAGRCRS